MTKDRIVLAVLATAASAAPCERLAAQSPLVYGVPSPPNAVYHYSDSMSIRMGKSLGLSASTSMTMKLDIEQDGHGIRLLGVVENSKGRMSSGFTGEMTMDGLMDGAVEFLVGSRGELRVVLLPGVAIPGFASLPNGPMDIGQASAKPPLAGVARVLYPPLPGRALEAGDTWADSVETSVESESMGGSNTAVTSYTLLGDTVVDGREMLHIAFTSEITAGISMDVGVGMTQTMKTSVTGLILWDTERGLTAYAQTNLTAESVSSGIGAGLMDMAMTASSQIRLERSP